MDSTHSSPNLVATSDKTAQLKCLPDNSSNPKQDEEERVALATQNVFHNPLLLESIMAYLLKNDLLNSRLVSPNWSKSGFRVLDFTHHGFRSVQNILASSKLLQFCDIMDAAERFPFHEFIINLHGGTTERSSYFFKRFSSHVRKLEIDGRAEKELLPTSALKLSCPVKAIRRILRSVQNLRKLELNNWPGSIVSQESLLPRDQKFHIDKATGKPTPLLHKLKSLVIKGWGDGSIVEYNALFVRDLLDIMPNLVDISFQSLTTRVNCVNFIPPMVTLKNLSVLRFHGVDGINRILDALILNEHEKGFKEFYINQQHLLLSDAEVSSLNTFLVKQRNELQVLSINVRVSHVQMSIEFPVMAKLTSLTLLPNVQNHMMVRNSSFILLSESSSSRDFPCLEQLHTHIFQLENSFTSRNDIPYAKVTKLTISYVNGLVTKLDRPHSDFTNVANMFPSLTHLFLDTVSGRGLISVFQNLEQLVELNFAFFVENSDKVNADINVPLSGLQQSFLDSPWINSAYQNPNLNSKPNPFLAYLDYTSPISIRNMKRLKRLEIRDTGCHSNEKFHIKDVSCVTGLMRIGRLNSLRLPASASTTISKQCISALRDYHYAVLFG